MTVQLLNGRDYVQGTQLLALAARSVPGRQARLESARFVRTTTRLVSVAAGGTTPANQAVLGSALFSHTEGRIQIDFVEQDRPAPCVERPEPSRLVMLDHDGALCGRFEASGLPNFQGLLEFLVEGLKRMHQEIPGGAVDVWFTGLRGLALPVDIGPVAHCAARVRPLRRLADGGRVQTYSDVHLQAGDDAWRGQVSFAFREAAQRHVD